MIDITNLTSLITAFRQETEQSSISPETLGSLLQKIADELANASTDQEILQLTAIKENLQTLGAFLYDIVQGPEDRNNILVNVTRFNPISGMKSAVSGQTFIKQATTARAGAMRAQHVDDLYTAKKNISALQTTAEEHQTSIDSINETLTENETTMTELDNSLSRLSTSLNTLNQNIQYAPMFRGNIVIDNTSITSPATNYFTYSLLNGYYNIIRSNQLIGRAVVSTYNNFKIVDVIGLCHINSNSFVYHDRLDHILLRIASNGAIYVTGSIETTDLKNQINLKQDKLTAGTGIDIDNNVISVNVIPESSFTLEFTASDGVVTGSFDETTYNELRQAIIDGKMIVVAGGVTRTTAISTALADDYLMIRYSVPRIQDDNATVTLSVYELKVSASSFTSKSIHKILPAA